MKVMIRIQDKFIEPQIMICNNKLTDEVKELEETILQVVNKTVTAYTENGAEIITYDSFIRFYAEKQKVYAQTKENKYILHTRLYELEEKLSENNFVRISNSEIVNIKKIKSLDTSITGTIRMYLQGDIETYVSRRNVKKIKKALEL
jgi:DNA-binding LytR/AlgR family response regulator